MASGIQGKTVVITGGASRHRPPHRLSRSRVEDERHLITKSCIVFIPAGIHHCPMNFLKVDRPVFHLSTGMTTKAYEREKGNANA